MKIKLQNILFPSLETCMTEDMYFRVKEPRRVSTLNNIIRLQKDGCMYFDTYFNGFSAEKWFKYTNIDTVSLTLKIKGSVRITLLRKERNGSGADTEYISEQLCTAVEPKEFTFEYHSVSDNGMYCFDVKSEKSGSELYGGYYSADIPQVRRVKLAIDICTFKREKFVEKNLTLLKNRFLNDPESELFEGLEVFISDNAGTLDIDSLSDEKIHIFKNKNTGGAGGFTRGLMEINRVKEQSGITHALLMDDDILIEPEAVFRTFVLLSCVKEKYYDTFVGGAMLRLDQKNIQVESGAVWAGGNILSLKKGLNLISCDNCLLNETEEYAQYNAWWYCAFPVDIAGDDNLPLPIFIRGDDVEYGLRNMRHLVLMNGICVWHEPFERKYSSFLFYYILRNRLIDNALHNMTVPKEVFAKLLEQQVMEQIRLYRYKNAELLMQGVEDFLKGTDWFMRQDGEALHKKVMSEGYKLQPVEELEEPVQFFYHMYEDSVNASNPDTFKYRILHKYTVNGIFYLPTSGARPYNVIPLEGAKDINVYRTEKVLNYDCYGKKGFITRKDPEAARNSLKRLKALKKRLLTEYDQAVRDFAENGKRLMTREFWEKYLELDKV